MSTPKVFGIGFQKTGTSSLDAALKILGFRTQHGIYINNPGKRHSLWIRRPLTTEKVASRAVPLAAGYEALSDNPWPLLFRQVDAAYPESRFILTVREPRNWLRSLVHHFGDADSDEMEWIYGVRSVAGNGERCLAVYNAHNAAVRGYFADRPDALLELHLGEKRQWDELCAFLGRPVPNRPFPRVNTAAERERKRNSLWRQLKTDVRRAIRRVTA